MNEKPKNPSRRVLFIIIGGGILLFCICGIILASFIPTDDPTPAPVADSVADTPEPTTIIVENGDALPTFAPTSTDTPQPTPIPTSTTVPTGTPDPNLVRQGTYLVNVDIEPGIYRGFAGVGIFSSCYWERLEDLSGELSAIIANENAEGQFYIEVAEDDFAFHVGCDVWHLDTLPEPVADFPDEIDVGMYLVGIDIQPGLYQGAAGDSILESCYWQRMRDLKGTLGSIIANDNSTGQYYIQVAASDFALQSSCPLVRVGE
jgi:hypothetical protein